MRHGSTNVESLCAPTLLELITYDYRMSRAGNLPGRGVTGQPVRWDLPVWTCGIDASACRHRWHSTPLRQLPAPRCGARRIRHGVFPPRTHVDTLGSGLLVQFERIVMQSTAVRCYEPEVHNPYPDREWNRIWGFRYESDLHLLRLRCGLPGIRREAQYIVAKPYLVSFKLDDEGTRRNITVPKGMLTDLASVPPPLRWYAGRVGPHLEAAIVHDFLYIAWQDLGIRPTRSMRRFADRMMLTAILAAGVPSRAHSIYRAVRLGGCCAFHHPEPCRYVDLDARQPPA